LGAVEVGRVIDDAPTLPAVAAPHGGGNALGAARRALRADLDQ